MVPGEIAEAILEPRPSALLPRCFHFTVLFRVLGRLGSLFETTTSYRLLWCCQKYICALPPQLLFLARCATGTARSRRRAFLLHPIPWTRLQASSTTRPALSLMYSEAERETDIKHGKILCSVSSARLPATYCCPVVAEKVPRRSLGG